MTVRAIAEAIAAGLEPGLERTMGESLELGLVARFHDEQVMKRRLPLRALQISFESGLADCMVVLTTANDDVARTAVTDAAAALVERLGVEAEVSSPVVHDFRDHSEALEQLDALHDEVTVHFNAHSGDFLFILGSGLVQTAGAALGIDAGSDEAVAAAGADDGDEVHERPSATGVVAAGEPVDADSLEPVGAAADAAQDAVFSNGFGTSAAANSAAAAPALDSRWSQLLSGVEVELSAELGRSQMRLGDLSGLTDQSVLTLDQLVDEPLTVYVNGALYATARLVVIDDEYGIEIVEVIEPALTC